VDTLVDRVEKYADRPWPRSIDPILTQPEGPLIASYPLGLYAYCVVHIPNIINSMWWPQVEVTRL
jgi:hypothetical protein